MVEFILINDPVEQIVEGVRTENLYNTRLFFITYVKLSTKMRWC